MERCRSVTPADHGQVHRVRPLGKKETAMLLLNLYPRVNQRDLAKDINIEKKATRQEYVEALQEHKLVQLVDGNPGVLVRVKADFYHICVM